MTKRGKCRVCGQELSVTAHGGVRVHGYARGTGETEVNCPGSGQKPLLDLDQQIVCLYCNGDPVRMQSCTHCKDGKMELREVGDYDALTVIENHMGDVDTEQAAEMLRQLMQFGFIEDPEEAPNPEGTGWRGPVGTKGTEADAVLLQALLQFFDDWKGMLRGPVKPHLLENKKKVDEALTAWKESRGVTP